MKKEINVKIDHVGMFSNRFHPADVMFQLGFSGEGGCKKCRLMKTVNHLDVCDLF